MTLYGISIESLDYSEHEKRLLIEMEAIRRGGKALGLAQHYLNLHLLLWPEDKQHRWFVLGMTSIVENRVSVFLGCANASKTYMMSCHALMVFFVFPKTSLALISSTDIRSLELRIWGRGIKWLFNRARLKYGDLIPGFVLDSKMAIVPDDIDDEDGNARAINMGLVCVPCVSGGKFVGLSKFQGIKPPSTAGKNDGLLSHYGDEVAVMQPSILDGYTNWMSNENFKGVMAGNPTDISDPLCIASEPVGGWDAFIDSGKTQTWRSRWHNANCIAFDGRDTPNNDEPKDQYGFLARSNYVQKLIETYGADSWQLYQQGIGKPSKNMVSNRVVTVGLCEQNGAFKNAVWLGDKTTKIYALDPAYGGGDRCVGGELEFGSDQNGNLILAVHKPEVIPIRINAADDAETQIAQHVFNRTKQSGISPENIFYDSFGRGTLGFSFAKVFGSNCPVPVDSGARPTARPVRFDLYVTEKDGSKRLKRCDEHYSKFVTEMWFSCRELIQSGQMRDLPRDVAEEGQLRLFSVVAGNKTEVESKDEMKERVKKSPDLFDWLAIGVEGARQHGFQIKRIGRVDEVEKGEEDYFDTEVKQWNDAVKSGLLKH